MVDRRLLFRDVALGCRDQDDIALSHILADHATRPAANRPCRESDAVDAPATPNRPFAKGNYVARTIRSDVQVIRAAYEVEADCKATLVNPPHLHIGVCFEGGHSYRVDGVTHRSPQASPVLVWHGHTTEGVAHHRSGERVVAAGLYVGDGFFEAARDELVLSASHDFFRFRRSDFLYQELPNVKSLASILRQIYCCPYRGFLETLYLESLCLSAIVALTVYLHGGGIDPSQTPTGRRNLAQEARELLDSDPDVIPSTRALARRLATNETTLRRCFKTAFGSTIVDYVRDRRLDRARTFVRDTHLQIAEIAYRTGYSDPANFTTAYRRRFGCCPTDDRRLMRRGA